MLMKKIILFPLLLIALTCGFASQAVAQTTVGATEAMGSLRIARDPVLLSMAGAGSAMTASNQAWAAFGNPAAAAFSTKKLEAGFSYAGWAPHYASAQNLAAGLSGHVNEKFALTLGFARQGYPGLDFETASAFKPSDLLIRAGVGVAFTESLAVGLTAGYMKEALLSDYSLSAFSVSALAQYRVAGLSVVAGVEHLGGKVGDGYSLPSSVKLAAAYCLSFGESGLDVAMDGDYYFSGNYGVSLGLNGCIGGIGFLRAGYRFASPGAVIPSHLGLGAGVALAGFNLDFTYLTASESLGGTWMVGLGYRF